MLSRPLTAQILGGQVVEAANQAPLARMPVFLFQQQTTKWVLVRSADADNDGLFQMQVPMPGVYRLAFGDTARPISLGPVDTLVAEDTKMRAFHVPLAAHVFEEVEVDLPVQARKNDRGPTYPPQLRERGLGGNVSVRVVIDSSGRADTASIDVRIAERPELVKAVLDYLRRARFEPAKWKGYVVRQRLLAPYSFIPPPRAPEGAA